MLVMLVMAFVTDFLRGVLDMMPDFVAPEWLTYVEAGWAFAAWSLVHKLGAWVPVESMGEVVAFLGAVLPLAAIVLFALWLWALVPIVGKKG